MRVELRLRVMAVATPTRLTLTALVGKPLNAIILIISGVGYKRRFGGTGFTSEVGWTAVAGMSAAERPYITPLLPCAPTTAFVAVS